jgi:hypothetical protein
MKHIIRNTMLSLLLVGASAAFGGVPSMNVTVFNARGQVVFKGATNANATFVTGNLEPGNYVVQFNSKSGAAKGNQYLLVISSGKKKVIADAVAGEKFTAGGVAMRLEVGPGLNIAGQVANEQAVSLEGNPKVKVINGRRYFWVTAETGSNLGGRWVEEGLAKAQNIVRLSNAYLIHVQDHAGEGSMLDYQSAASAGFGSYH